MKQHPHKPFLGIGLAVLATLIWSGNFIVARGVFKEISPISLAFFRWLTASVLLTPLAFRAFKKDIPAIRNSLPYLVWCAVTGISLFNTFVYVAGHYATAINLVLIGTTSSPVMVMLISRFILRERMPAIQVIGVSISIAGILLLISKGDLRNLADLQFSRGDGFILLAAFFFAVYNVLVRRKPAEISPLGFLWTIFVAGTLILTPFFFWDQAQHAPILWTPRLYSIILYLGAGTSIISYFCWNVAIDQLGASRTAIFGNLIPLFATIEAIIILGEQIQWLHVICGSLVIGGLVIANLRLKIKRLAVNTEQ